MYIVWCFWKLMTFPKRLNSPLSKKTWYCRISLWKVQFSEIVMYTVWFFRKPVTFPRSFWSIKNSASTSCRCLRRHQAYSSCVECVYGSNWLVDPHVVWTNWACRRSWGIMCVWKTANQTTNNKVMQWKTASLTTFIIAIYWNLD